MKKLLLIVIDALTSRVMLPALAEGRLPQFQRLAEAGYFNPKSVAVFPSITPAATSSIITGRYPAHHNILGANWYDVANNEIIYYGDDFWAILNKGVSAYFRDLLTKLNHQWLRAPTLFQIIEKKGLTAANLNYLIFRGQVKHQAQVPIPFNLLPGLASQEELYGASIMYYGDLVQTRLEALDRPLTTQGGPLNRYGFKDQNTGELLLQLAQEKLLPDFTLAYFPDNDFRSHQVGPAAALNTVEKIDDYLGQLIETFGGLDKMLAELALIITGDHAQSEVVAQEPGASIWLNQTLDQFTVADVGKLWSADDDLMISLDMRTAQLYFKEPGPENIQRAIERLLAEPRLDQVIWRANRLDPAKSGFYVATQDRGRLYFWAERDGDQAALDRYGGRWRWRGELEILDGQVEDGRLRFGDYPNAFERIRGALDHQSSGHIWVTARPGHEFRLPGASVHPGGGSHGSLHRLDSYSPLLVAGAPAELPLPQLPRAVDIAPLCLAILGLKSPAPGQASHVPAGST